MDELETELARVAEREPVVQAWAARHHDDAIRAEVARAVEGGRGPLAGWTLGVKDVIDTVELTTERGSPIHAGRVASADASCVALARRAGAVVVGKTVTTEFAFMAPAATTNPHDPARTPGGSSSGSAAAVADGMVRVAFGTQTVGSVIRPASFCGVVGFKPTYGLVPTTGVAHLSPSFDTVGWMSRSVDDARAVLDVLAGGAGPRWSRRRVRLGRYRSHQWAAAEPELVELWDRVADRLEDGGVEVVDIEPSPHLDGAFDAAAAVLRHEVPRALAWEWEAHRDLVSPSVAALLVRSEGAGAAVRVADAQRRLAAARSAHARALDRWGVDALVTPAAPGEAPPIDTTGDSVFNRVWTALGVPAISLPAGSGPRGLPIGVQLVGLAWADHHLLTVADRVEGLLVDR